MWSHNGPIQTSKLMVVRRCIQSGETDTSGQELKPLGPIVQP